MSPLKITVNGKYFGEIGKNGGTKEVEGVTIAYKGDQTKVVIVNRNKSHLIRGLTCWITLPERQGTIGLEYISK